MGNRSQQRKNFLSVPRVSLQKGLPFGIDVGSLDATVPGTGIHSRRIDQNWPAMLMIKERTHRHKPAAR
jgi:hypothetical protein